MWCECKSNGKTLWDIKKLAAVSNFPLRRYLGEKIINRLEKLDCKFGCRDNSLNDAAVTQEMNDVTLKSMISVIVRKIDIHRYTVNVGYKRALKINIIDLAWVTEGLGSHALV